MGLEHKRQHYYYSRAWLASCHPPAAFYLPSHEAGKIPPGLINMRETCENGGVWRREVMAEGRSQACKHWHKQSSAWRGGRAMRVSARGNEKEIPGNFSLYGCSSPTTKMLLWCEKNSRVARGATCPRVLSVSKLLRHCRAGTGHIDMLPNNSQAHFRSDSGPEMVTIKTQSHCGLQAEALWAESHITSCQLAQSSGRPLATFQLLQLKHLRKWRFSSAFCPTFYSALILPHATLLRSRKLRKLFLKLNWEKSWSDSYIWYLNSFYEAQLFTAQVLENLDLSGHIKEIFFSFVFPVILLSNDKLPTLQYLLSQMVSFAQFSCQKSCSCWRLWCDRQVPAVAQFIPWLEAARKGQDHCVPAWFVSAKCQVLRQSWGKMLNMQLPNCSAKITVCFFYVKMILANSWLASKESSPLHWKDYELLD